MADWRDNFRQGSFRGVEFFTRAHEESFGRRKVDHEFPDRENSRSEDLGKKVRTYSLTLLVIGDDYFAKRDALQDALEQDGEGELIHPYKGRKTVQAGTMTLTETVNDGRMATFTVEFSEAGEDKFPQSVEDGVQNTINNADGAIDAAVSFFESVFSVANQAAHVVDSATEDLNAALDFMEDAVKKVTEPIANLTFAISNMKASANALIRAPGVLAQRLKDTFGLLLDELSDSPELAQAILGSFKDLSFPPIILATPTPTPSREIQQRNQDVMEDFTKELAHSNEAKAAVNTEFSNVSDAIAVRDSVEDNIEFLLDREIGDDLFQALKDVQASLVRSLPPTSDIGDLISFTPPKTLPALVIAYALFQDLDREQEIIDENLIQQPGFVQGGVTIEVASG